MRNLKALLLAALLLLPAPALSAAKRQPASIGYAVRALLPENQANRRATYFDLLAEPGQTQTLRVSVQNREGEAMEVAVEANAAFTNENGIIAFTASEVRDMSMEVDFAEILTPVREVITVPAYGEAVAEFTLTLPETPFEGVVYGGLLFTRLNQEKENPAGGLQIHNIYRYVIGVVIRESDAPAEPAFELTTIEHAPGENSSLILHLRNTRPAIAKGMTLRVEMRPLSDRGGEPLLYQQTNVSMAPNSAMPYRLYLENGEPLAAGDWEIAVELSCEDTLFRDSMTLRVSESPDDGQ